MANLTRAQRAEREANKYWLPYVTAAKEAGVQPDQIMNFIKAGLVLQKRQLEFVAACRECDKPDGPTALMFAGGRGAAKTFAIYAQIFADDCQRFPGLKVLVLRKVGKANKEQVNDIRTKLLKNIPHKYKEQAATIDFPNGSQVIIGGFKDERDLDKFLGLEYDLINIGESNQISFTKKKFIMTCLRTSKPGWRPRVYEDTNPGGIAHADNKKIYYDPWKEGREKETGTRFFHTDVYDNAFINKEYVAVLESLTGWQRKAWLEGSWEFRAGAFFTNWNDGWHVYPNQHIQFAHQTSAVKWYAGYDYGFAHPAAFILACEDKLGNTYIVDEYHQNETTVQEQADDIRALLHKYQLEPRDLDYIAAGRDCFARGKDGKTVAMEFEDAGIILQPTEIDRINAWAVMQQRLGNVDKNVNPTLFINQRCHNLISQIPMLQCHETRIGDIEKMNASEDGTGGDDAADAARNLLVFGGSSGITTAIPMHTGRPVFQLDNGESCIAMG